MSLSRTRGGVARSRLAMVERLEARSLLSTSPAMSPAAVAVAPARQVENLNRGIVAMNKGLTSGSTNRYNIYVGWRMLATDPSDISFNIYRAVGNGTPVKRNGSPITATTDYTETSVDISQALTYSVRPIINGVEQPATESYTLAANAPARQYIPIPLVAPPVNALPDGSTYTYNANDASAGDVDGDGQYEIILKWDPSNSKDNSQSGYTGNVYFDCYKLDGTRLWRINMGRNMRAGAHYSPFLVYDFDGDGKSEFVLRTAPGTIDGAGNAVILPGDNPNADYRNSGGYVLSGPEYLTVFNGQTGAAMATANFFPDRGDVTQWGDGYGNRVDRFNATVAYLDGVHPSIVMARGYYGPDRSHGFTVARNELAAYDWRGGQLSRRWTFKATTGINGNINSNYIAQGTHNITVGDVDGDGKDEIIYGSATINDDGTGLYSTGLGHGDALMMTDMIPSRPGLEVFQVHEDTGGNGHIGGSLRDAATGQVIVGLPVTQGTDGSWPDVGRGNAFDIDPNYAGYEFWDSAHGSIYSVDGTAIQAKPSNMFHNFGIWWDADPLRELLDGTTISDWKMTNGVGGRSNLVSSGNSGINNSSGLSSNNGTKSTPALVADLLGDWREEVIWRKSDSTELQIWTTTIASTNRIYTLMQDPSYRESVAFQNSGYNQPTQPGFFLGAANASGALSTIPAPNVYTVEADLTAPTVTGSQFLYENMQAITVDFDEPMKSSTFRETNLVIHPLSFSGYDIQPFTYFYDSSLHRATYYILGQLPDGNYRATLAAGNVTDTSGNALASDYNFDFFALNGDANRDRAVDIRDLAILATNWQGTGRVFSQGDFNYDGGVDAKDLGILSGNWQKNLPEEAPISQTVSLGSRAPKRPARMISLIQ